MAIEKRFQKTHMAQKPKILSAFSTFENKPKLFEPMPPMSSRTPYYQPHTLASMQ